MQQKPLEEKTVSELLDDIQSWALMSGNVKLLPHLDALQNRLIAAGVIEEEIEEEDEDFEDEDDESEVAEKPESELHVQAL